ncbi:MAG: hypothetical protein N2738_01860, partial [Thermodesulfovibrionales bacterium]|nr:hypothetical protein [Thermodesulfovibrionales bacterium]
MIIDKKSLIFKTFVPILVLTFFITVITFAIISKIISIIEEENIRLLQQRHNFEIRKIIDKALTEITTSRMLRQDMPMLLQIKQNDVMSDIKTYWEKNDLKGAIVVNNKEIKMSNLDFQSNEEVKKYLEINGYKVIDDTLFLTIKFPAWDWTILTSTQLTGISKTKKFANYIIPIN